MTTTRSTVTANLLRVGVAVIAAAAVLLTLLPAAANAKTTTTNDPDAGGYISAVRVTHAPRKVFITVFARPGNGGEGLLHERVTVFG